MNVLKVCAKDKEKPEKERRNGKQQLPIFVKQSSVSVMSKRKTFLFGNLDQLMFSLIFIMIKYCCYLLARVCYSRE